MHEPQPELIFSPVSITLHPHQSKVLGADFTQELSGAAVLSTAPTDKLAVSPRVVAYERSGDEWTVSDKVTISAPQLDGTNRIKFRVTVETDAKADLYIFADCNDDGEGVPANANTHTIVGPLFIRYFNRDH